MNPFKGRQFMNTPSSFWPLYQQLKSGRFIDLTHSFAPDIPHFEGATNMCVKEVQHYQEGGFFVQQFQFEGQWGTHVDAPSHCFEGKDRSIKFL